MAEEKKELIQHSKRDIGDISFISDIVSDEHDKKDCWLSSVIQLNAISMVHQTFDINAVFHIFWIDSDLTQSQLDKMDLFHDGKINTGYELPLDPMSIFFNASQVDHISDPSIEIYDKNKNVLHLKIAVRVSLHEHFELDKFPFDSQFLNIKVLYNVTHYNVLSVFPKQWIKTIENGGSGHYDRVLQITKLDSLNSWEMLSPWFDFRNTRNRFPYNTNFNNGQHDLFYTTEKYYRFKFAIIRLRLQRIPNFFFQQIIFPLFLIVTCSFATFSMDPDEFVGDRFSYVVTLLLTVVAFQYAIQGDMPVSAEITHVDRYIIWAYICLFLLIVEVAIANLLHVGYYTTVGEGIMCAFLIIMWLYGTLVYIIIPWRNSKNVNWELLSNMEMEEWDQHKQESFKGVDTYHMHATQCKTDVMYMHANKNVLHAVK
eukprot:109135_1